jgi:UDP-glucose:(heptosyl)LPS alpha-1,3-glucosyltransferase
MNLKKLALIRSGYSPFGGIEMHALSLMNKLLSHNVQIDLLTWPNQNWPISHPNLNIVEMGANKGTRLFQSWIFNKSVRQYLQDRSYHCVFSMDQVDTCTHIHAGGGSHKVFLQIKNQSSSVISRMFRKISLFHNYLLFLEKKAFTGQMLQKIRCCSEMVRQDISNHYQVPEHKMIVVHNGIDWSGIGSFFEDRLTLKEKIQKKDALNPNWKILLFLGSGFQRKGLDIAIKGLAHMDDNFHLLVIGKGSPKPFMQIAKKIGVENRVHILGPQEKGWQYAAVCKGFVLPSRYEPFGRAAAEAQSMGIPALVSNRTGYAELIQHKKNGIVINFPESDNEIHNSFHNFADLINNPVLTSEDIRNHIAHLDDESVIQTLIRDFLSL